MLRLNLQKKRKELRINGSKSKSSLKILRKLRGKILVLLSIENSKTKVRKISALKGLDDEYKKIVITMDNNPFIRLEDGYKI